MNSYRFIFLILFITLLGGNDVLAQTSRARLEQEKKRNLNRIAQTKKVLAQTQRKKTISLRELKTLSRQIEDQEQQIQLLEKDLALLEKELRAVAIETHQLDQRLKALREEYGQMLYSASKTSTKLNQLLFLFSSASFQEIMSRYQYLQQYTDNRKDQLAQIRKVTLELNTRRLELSEKKKSQTALLSQKRTQNVQLVVMKSEKDTLVNELAKQEVALRQEIEASNAAVRNLDKLISSLVAKEMAKKEEKKSASPPPQKSSSKKKEPLETKSTRVVVGRFNQAKKRLPWPVKTGFVSDRFGVKNHPVLKGVQIDNNGIDIQTVPGASVYSVFAGKVLDISEIPGMGQVVAVQHGEYFTIYANLDQVQTKVGESIGAGDVLGTAGLREGVAEINFQIWHQFERLNPEIWLTRK